MEIAKLELAMFLIKLVAVPALRALLRFLQKEMLQPVSQGYGVDSRHGCLKTNLGAGGGVAYFRGPKPNKSMPNS